jgi:ribosomal protein S18 acetylase RimI-like enzyme
MNEPGQPPITIRAARPEEFATIGEIVVAAYQTLGTESDDYVEYLRDTAARADAGAVLAALDESGTVLGTVTYVPGPGTALSEIERDNEGGFRALAVEPAAHGRGVGRALVMEVIARARAEGRVGVAMYTRPSMVAAQHLYESVGFSRQPADDWNFEPGEWLWAYRLRF